MDTESDINEAQEKTLISKTKKMEKKTSLPVTKSIEMLSISSDTIYKVGQSINALEKSSEKSFALVILFHRPIILNKFLYWKNNLINQNY